MPGPVTDLKIEETTDTGVVISWNSPITGTVVDTYQVEAISIKSYSSSPVPTLSWNVQKELRKFELLNLQPSTKYNISVTSKSRETGGATSILAETLVGGSFYLNFVNTLCNLTKKFQFLTLHPMPQKFSKDLEIL